MFDMYWIEMLKCTRLGLPVEVSHVTLLDNIILGFLSFSDLLLGQPLLVLLQFPLVCCCHKLLLVTKQVILCRAFLCQSATL